MADEMPNTPGSQMPAEKKSMSGVIWAVVLIALILLLLWWLF